MGVLTSEKDEPRIEFGLVFSCGNDHHYCILGVWVMPMTLKISKRVKKINAKTHKGFRFSFFSVGLA